MTSTAYVDGTDVDAQESAVLDALFGSSRKRTTRYLASTDIPLGTRPTAIAGITRNDVIDGGWRAKATGSRPRVDIFAAVGLAV